MSAASSQVLREYLVSLGFKIDKTGASGMDNTLLGLDKRALALGGSLTGVLAAAQAMTQSFAHQMESMYYSSRRIGTTVGNLKSMEQGATRVGVSGEAMRATLEAMGKLIKTQPGVAEMLENWGVPVRGRDVSDVLKDTVAVLKTLPPHLQPDFAAAFGIDYDTMFKLIDGYDDFIAAEKRQHDMMAQVGTDYEKAAEAGRKYANMLRDIKDASGALMDTLMVKLMPLMEKWQRGISGGLLAVAESINKPELAKGVLKEVVGDIKAGADQFKPKPGATAPITEANKIAEQVRSGMASKLFEALEDKFGIKPGTMDRFFGIESSRGRNLLSPAGAQGPFQFMPGTAKDMGIKNPNDLEQSATGFAKYFTMLLKRYNGDEQAASAAYNWGLGNVDKQYGPWKHGYGLGGTLPQETLGYLDKQGLPYSQGGMSQSNVFHIHGTDPAGTARAVRSELDGANQDLTRNLRGNVR